MKALYLILISTLFLGCTEGFQREMKTLQSNWLGGLDRLCRVFSLSGEEIARYEGRFDMQSSERQLFFDIKGKRVIVLNATVICEEK